MEVPVYDGCLLVQIRTIRTSIRQVFPQHVIAIHIPLQTLFATFVKILKLPQNQAIKLIIVFVTKERPSLL